jgi:bifunctional enzyme CysN/CysC
MATGASTAELAVILVDARKGVLTQTRRHTRIVTMMGITHVVLAINKMDLVSYQQSAFDAITAEYRAFAASCGLPHVQPMPISALEGDNVVESSTRMPWYDGPTLLRYLEDVDVADPADTSSFRMPVQWVNRPSQDFRGFAGRVAAGTIRPGDRVRVMPGRVETTIQAIVGVDGELESARRGESTLVTLADEVDVSRGDVIAAAADPPGVCDQFEATLLWMHEQELIPGRPYLFKTHSKELTVTITALKYRLDVTSGAHLAARTLALNDIGVVNLSLARPVPFEPYATNRVLGGFILIDMLTFDTLGAGMLAFGLRRADNLHWQALEVDRQARAAIKHQQPCCVWLTGLSASGKSSIANLLEKRLHEAGRHTYLLDGDNVRHGLSRDLGFTEGDRAENVRRVAEVAKLMVDAGLIVIVAFISPRRSERRFARGLFDPGAFVEVFVDTPLAECERRDPKGLYARARAGLLPNFTGIDSAYEPPEHPEVRVATMALSAAQSVDLILERLP